MARGQTQQDRYLLFLICLVPGLVVAGWAFNLPAGGLVGMGVVGGLISVVFAARMLSTRWELQTELDEGLGELVRALSLPVGELGNEDTPRVIRRLATAAAARSQAASVELSNLRAILDGAATPLLATNAAGEVLVCNRACEEFFARASGTLVGLSIEELFTQAEVLGLHASALAGKPRQGQVRMQRPDGQRVYQVLTAPVALREGQGVPQTGVVVSLRDVTELAVAVQLKTDFVANASHELRTPLASIKAAVETLADGAWDDPSMRNRLTQMIAGNVGRLEEMVGDLLDLSRLESAEVPISVQPVSLTELASALSDDFGPIVRERKLELAFVVDPSVDRLRTDSKLLMLVLKNLIDNAAKFAYEGTTIGVSAVPLGGLSVPGVRIQVSDKGVGIPISQQQRVFERFFQVDPARTGFAHRRGTGLGLAIVKHAVKALGGTISVESVWKQGTTMTVDLPLNVEAVQGGGAVIGA